MNSKNYHNNSHRKRNSDHFNSSTISSTIGTTKSNQTITGTNRFLPFHGKIVVVSTNTNGKQNDEEEDAEGGGGEHHPQQQHPKQQQPVLTESYKSLSKLCKQLGATITNQVHSRVYCVVATNEAVIPTTTGNHNKKKKNYSSNQNEDDEDDNSRCSRNHHPPPKSPAIATPTTTATQRVRKAWKRNIPVVTTQYIYDCQQRMQLIVPITENYIITANATASCTDPVPSSSSSSLFIKTYAKTDDETDNADNNRDQGVKKKRKVVDSTFTTAPDDHTTDDALNDNKTAVNMPQPREEGIVVTVDLGCCCICHEEGWTTNCSWCNNNESCTITT